ALRCHRQRGRSWYWSVCTGNGSAACLRRAHLRDSGASHRSRRPEDGQQGFRGGAGGGGDGEPKASCRRSFVVGRWQSQEPQPLPLRESPEEIQILSFSADSNPPKRRQNAVHKLASDAKPQPPKHERQRTALGPRRKSRELTLQMLFQADMGK